MKKTILKKAINLNEEIETQINNYDVNLIEAMEDKIKALKDEFIELQKQANVLDGSLDAYLLKQKKLKELPKEINRLEQEKIKLYSDRENMYNSLCKGASNKIGSEITEEFNNNMMEQQEKLYNVLLEAQKIVETMEQLEKEYTTELFNIINTQGVYITFNSSPYINTLQLYFNMPKGALRFKNQYSKDIKIQFQDK